VLVRENIPLAPLTTLDVGGPARYFAEATTESEVLEAVQFARSDRLPLFVLGGGSNLVIADAGFAGLALKIAITGIAQFAPNPGNLIFNVGAGCDWDTFVAQTVEAGCAGLECLSGIPGTVGGTPVQNVGAYGQEVADTIIEVRALDLQSLEVVTLSKADCRFTYRTSIFNTTDRGRYIVLRVAFALRPCGKPTIRYADLEKHFAGNGSPTLSEVRAAVREIRRRKAMLIVPGDEDARSAGSFFQNPVVPQVLFGELATRFPGIPSYPAGDGLRKVPAAWLVEQAGFAKGYMRGRAAISRKHALAIVNRGGATAAEIIALKDEIQAGVQDMFGIHLQPEPVFAGFPGSPVPDHLR
jgi:UDP-N-acetylmuramate dehydrogenase